MTRTERQKEAIKKWIANKGKGTVEAATGFGKTRIALTSIESVLKKYPQLRILVVVPTTTLKNQWQTQIDELGFSFNVEVQVINTVVKYTWKCDMLVIDEIHRVASDLFKLVFEKVSYKLILGLTATFDRLDGKQTIISKYCPIVDTVSILECQVNGWVSEYKEYIVLIDVDNIGEFKELNKEFIRYFEFFNYDFDSAKNCCGKDGWKYALKLRDEMYQGNDETKRKELLKAITVNAMALMRNVQKRKLFINNHPKKIEIAKKIINARPDKKIITFSNNVKMAEAIGVGEVYTGRVSKKRGNNIIEEFNNSDNGVLNTCAKEVNDNSF